MASRKWPKNEVKSGDVISFLYKSRRRNVIVMECPNDVGRAGKFITKQGEIKKFLHGIEIPLDNRYDSKIENLIKKMGGTRVLFESRYGDRFYTVNFGTQLKDIMNARAAYDKVKSDVKDMDIYKTYDWSIISQISLNNIIVDFEDLINPRYKLEEEK